MKRRLATLVIYPLFALALTVGCIRLGLTAWRCEIGGEMLAVSWRDATIGRFGWKHQFIGELEPTEQADFWLAEIDRLEQIHPETAEFCAGAAMLLDTPDTQYRVRYYKPTDFGATGPGIPTFSFDYDADKAAKEKFEAKCSERCLALAARATELEPDDVRWWRLRAGLLFHEELSLPRRETWLDVLDECSRHDPDNALYDYLAALALFDEAADWEWILESEEAESDGNLDAPWHQQRLTIHDAERFQQAVERFERARSKPYMAMGEDALPAMIHLFELGDVPRLDQLPIAKRRRFVNQQAFLLTYFYRWQQARVDNAQQAGDPARAAAVLCQSLRLFEQVAVSNGETSVWHHFDILPENAYRWLVDLAEKHPDAVDRKDLDQAKNRAAAILVESAVIQRAAAKRWANVNPPMRAFYQTALLDACQTSVGLLVAIACVVLGIGFGIAKRDAPAAPDVSSSTPRFGLWRHLAAWTVGYAASFALFGMVPAEMIAPWIQDAVVTFLGWILPSAIVLRYVAWPLLLAWKRRRFQFRLRSLFIATTVTAVLLVVGPPLLSAYSRLVDRVVDLQPVAKGFGQWDASLTQNQLGIRSGTWPWAAVQWTVHDGVSIGAAVSLLLAALWFARRCARGADESFFRYWTHGIRTRWPDVFRNVGRSALVVGACLLLLYAWSAPSLLRESEAVFQRDMLYYRNPRQYREDFQTARTQVLADKEEMAWIRKQAENDLLTSGF